MQVKPFTYTAPSLPNITVPTGFMIEMENRFKSVFHQIGFLVWYGAAGAGKTTCGQWLAERVNQAFAPDNPLAFKSIIYEVAKTVGVNNGKRALRTLYKQVTGYAFDPGQYRDNDAEFIADEVLYAIKRKRLGLICVDEAGLLSVDAISALALLLDKAKEEKYPLTIILIGMDDLPMKMDERKRPQLHRRVHTWCNFKAYDFEDSYNLLTGLHPYFKSLDRNNPEHWNQVRLVHELTGGLPGLIVQFLAQFDGIYRKTPNAVTTTMLRSIHLQNLLEYREILAAASGRAIPREKATDEKKNGKKNGKKT